MTVYRRWLCLGWFSLVVSCAQGIESNSGMSSGGYAANVAGTNGTGATATAGSGNGRSGSGQSGGTGGTPLATGGVQGGAGGECNDGQVAACADVYPSFPKGSTTCQNGSYPTSACHLCDQGDTIDCSQLPFNPKPYGKATCDPAAGFGKGDWNTVSCGSCDPGVTTKPCSDIAGKNYTGGQATCNQAGSGWVETACTVCGDGVKNELEQCDGNDVTPTTCGALDFGGVDPATPVTTCASNCKYDTSQCGNCSGGVAAGDCMNGGVCQAAACDGKGCARGTSCEFWCRDSAANACSDVVCSQNATCRFDCYNNGGCVGVDCRAGASCNLRCQNVGGHCDDVHCEDGALCNFSCSDGGSCATRDTVHCKSGQECTIACSNGGHCSGVSMVCDTGSICHLDMDNAASAPNVVCQDGATCHLHCLTANCAAISCTGSKCYCESGTCTAFP